MNEKKCHILNYNMQTSLIIGLWNYRSIEKYPADIMKKNSNRCKLSIKDIQYIIIYKVFNLQKKGTIPRKPP